MQIIEFFKKLLGINKSINEIKEVVVEKSSDIKEDLKHYFHAMTGMNGQQRLTALSIKKPHARIVRFTDSTATSQPMLIYSILETLLSTESQTICLRECGRIATKMESS